MKPMVFLGAPADSVGRGAAAELAPSALRELGLPAALGEDGGDLPVRIRGERRDPASGLLAADDVLATTRTIRAAAAERIGAGERPFVAGGCCALLPGALAGARDALGPDLALVHLDGHADLYDGETSTSGEAADMPVAVALGLGPAAWVEAAGGASVRGDRAALLGYRDREESLRDGMRQPESLDPRPLLFPVEELRAAGATATAERIAAGLGSDSPVWLHFDVDVLDREAFPATEYLMPDGLGWEEVGAVLAPLFASPALVGASLACYDPERDPDRTCGRRLVEAVEAATGSG